MQLQSDGHVRPQRRHGGRLQHGQLSKLVYVFPKVTGCGWLGLGYVGSSGAWINGENTVLVFGHELGHNFGVYTPAASTAAST